MKALIVTGGRGTRLLPATQHAPKHLLPVVNRPIIDWTLMEMERVSTLDCTILLGHHSQSIVNHLNQNLRGGVSFYLDKDLRGMWSGVRTFWREHSQATPLLLWIGDTFARVDIASLIDAHRAARPALTAVVTQSRYGGIVRGVFTCSDSALQYSERTVQKGEVINLGVYILGELSLLLLGKYTSNPRTEDFIRRVLSTGDVLLYELDSYGRNINTFQDLWETNRFILEEQMVSKVHSSPLALHPSAVIHRSAIVNNYSIVGRNAIVEAGADIRDSVVLPNTTVSAGLAVRGCVIGKIGDEIYAVTCNGDPLT
jgi:NDP-sugar pyrophosphorylase family protein